MSVVTYTYDAWCIIIYQSGTMADINLYRSYRYGSDTGLYCLQSRYYNPTFGRFINIDGLIIRYYVSSE